MTDADRNLLYEIARIARCLRCYFHLSSQDVLSKAAELKDARGVARAMLIDAASYQNEAQAHLCKCNQHLLT